VTGDEDSQQKGFEDDSEGPRALTQYLCGHNFGTLREQNTAKVRFETHITARAQAFEIKGVFIEICYESM
jgi:hypothetical protein